MVYHSTENCFRNPRHAGTGRGKGRDGGKGRSPNYPATYWPRYPSKGPGGKGKGSVRGYGRGLAASAWNEHEFEEDYEDYNTYGFAARCSDLLD